MEKLLTHMNKPSFLILNTAVKDEHYFLMVKDAMKKEWIDDPPTTTYKALYTYLNTYYDSFKQLPTLKVALEDLQEFAADIDFGAVKDIFESDYEREHDQVIQQTESFIRERMLEEEIRRIVAEDDFSSTTRLHEISTFSLDDRAGVDLFDVDRLMTIIHDMDEDFITSTGDAGLNNVIGGWRAKSLSTILGASGFGKSLFLANFAAATAKEGNNVVIYTLEMSEAAYAQRLMSLITDIPMRDLLTNAERAKKNIEAKYLSLKKTHKLGRLVIKEFPTKTATVNTLKGHLKNLPFKPDIVFVDYAELLRPSQKFNSSWEELTGIFGECRAMAIENDIPVVTAAQTNRKALDDNGSGTKEYVSQVHTGGSIGIIQISDVVLTIQQSNLQKEEGVIELNPLKNRYGATNQVQEYFVEYDKSKIEFSQANRTKEAINDKPQPKEEDDVKSRIAKWQ